MEIKVTELVYQVIYELYTNHDHKSETCTLMIDYPANVLPIIPRVGDTFDWDVYGKDCHTYVISKIHHWFENNEENEENSPLIWVHNIKITGYSN